MQINDITDSAADARRHLRLALVRAWEQEIDLDARGSCACAAALRLLATDSRDIEVMQCWEAVLGLLIDARTEAAR